MKRIVLRSTALAALLAIGPSVVSEPADRALPAPPANGEMGFVVSYFIQPVIQGPDACPAGTVPKLREAFLLRAELELGPDDIAQATGVGRETAKSRLRYAVARLRERLGP